MSDLISTILYNINNKWCLMFSVWVKRRIGNQKEKQIEKETKKKEWRIMHDEKWQRDREIRQAERTGKMKRGLLYQWWWRYEKTTFLIHFLCYVYMTTDNRCYEKKTFEKYFQFFSCYFCQFSVGVNKWSYNFNFQFSILYTKTFT